MEPKEHILKVILKAYANAPQTDASKDSTRSGKNFSQNEIIQELIDGMSTGTARIIIEQEVSQAIKEKLDIDQVKNKGRYYMAKIVHPIEARFNGCWLISKQGVCKWLGAEQEERAVGMLFFFVH